MNRIRTDITRPRHLNPRRHRTYPRAVRRRRRNAYPAKKPADTGTRHPGPPRIRLLPKATKTKINLS